MCHISEERTFKYQLMLFFVKLFPFSAYLQHDFCLRKVILHRPSLSREVVRPHWSYLLSNPQITKSYACSGPAHTSQEDTFTVFTVTEGVTRNCPTVLSLLHITTRVAATHVGCSCMLITQCIQTQQHQCQQVDALHLPLTPSDVIIVKIRSLLRRHLKSTIFFILLCFPLLTILR